MKTTVLGIICFFTCMLSTQAQALFSSSLNGGDEGAGTIGKFVIGTNDLTVAKSFENFAGNPLYANFLQASDGKLYGMTSHGGRHDVGVIFAIDPSTAAYTKLKDFDLTNGGIPYGSLIQARDGKFYGMTSHGGTSSNGVIFSFNPATSTYTKLLDFDEVNGGSPFGSLMEANDGKLYGMTIQGGSSGFGVIFCFDPVSSVYTKLTDFDPENGQPYGSLIQATDGKLYGMTLGGGSNNAGVIFSYDVAASAYTKLMEFDNTNGANPSGSFIQASDGKLYGMTSQGGSNGYGVIFSFVTSSGTYTKLKDLDLTDGGTPYGDLMQASDGKIYGMTDEGGNNGYGVIFSFDLSSSQYTRLNDFDDTNGANPYGGLVQTRDGKLGGMTSQGGNNSSGVLFSFDPASSTYTKLRDFSNAIGHTPSGSLIKSGNGKLYGMTTNGGNRGVGVIFSYDPLAQLYTKLKDFDNIHGANPRGSLMQASDGKLYGMTEYGGSNGYGVIFSFDLSTGIYTTLVDFDVINGGNPSGSLIQASDGKLYGMTANWSGGYGNIFSFDPASSVYSVLMDFGSTHGANPSGSLVQASDGKLYGMTVYGGRITTRDGEQYGRGDVFSFDPLAGTYKLIMNFNYSNGAYPFGNLIQARNGKLYGMTFTGGSNEAGVIFSFDPSASAYAKLVDFDNTTGGSPYGNLAEATDGNLYGATYQGGSSDDGVIFSFNPSDGTYTMLQEYNGSNGANPYTGSAFTEVPQFGPLPVALLSLTGINNGNSNRLSWKVEGEQNLNYYELQRSTGGQNFKGITQMKASGNNSYTYDDYLTTLTSSLYYYRLKIVDKDGNYKYSGILKLKINHNGFAVLTPNPFINRMAINVESLSGDKATFIITDVNGRLLYKGNKQLSQGANLVEIDETHGFAKGAYVLTIIESERFQTIKVIKAN